MIPQRLRLRNFMSYGDVPVEVDFDGVHLACLCGPNGHGKSALLDAVTWALWGRSRARREDDLVRQGSTEMEIEFCFEVAGRGYRVLRKRSLKSVGRTALELQALGDGGYSAMTGASMAETQSRIDEILKLSYDVFINSTFLLQGRADEFTVKPPAQRKEVLGEILGLAEYERLADRARERVRARSARAAVLREELAEKEADLAHRPRLRQELAEAEQAHEGALAALREAEAALQVEQARRQSLAAEERNLEMVERKMRASQAEIALLRERHGEAMARIAAAVELLAHEQQITADYEELKRLRVEADEMAQRLSRVREAQSALDRVHHEIEAAAAELRGTIERAGKEAQRFGTIAGELPGLLKQIQQGEAGEARLAALEGERTALAAELQQVRGRLSVLETQNKQLETEMGPLRDRLKLLKEPGALCPVCEKPMGEDERRRVADRYREDGLARKRQVDENKKCISSLQATIAQLEKQDGTLATTVAGLSRQVRELAGLRERARRAEEAVAAVSAAQGAAAAATLTMERQDYAQEARARLAQVESALAAIGYDKERHAALRSRMEELSAAEERLRDLALARERRQTALEAVAAVESDIERRQAELAHDERNAAGLREALAGLPELEQRLEACERSHKEARAAVDSVARTIAALRERLHLLDQQEEQLRERRAELNALEREAGAYDELSRIFGKKGIQAMVIDSALPELEQRANDVLSRMSDGAMQVRFSTQAQGSRGNLLETLDISIADATGTRPYEMFSGGEAFRANFAIRIALSRLLAERAGAQLQMLVVDEGFGTQDSQGRERLVEAVNAIAADFEKIIVITHIDELKDLFATRIEVVKGAEGSRVTITP